MSARQDWFRDQKWGIFTHYLNHEQNRAGSPTDMGRGGSDWNDCVNEFDTEKLASQLEEIGAHYLVFTVMQGGKEMCAPNETYNRITGYKTGEACSERDLIEDLYQSLSKRGISLFLYYTGDGPYKDEQAGSGMKFLEPREAGVTMEFVKNWASVLQEYAVRYGDKVKGWWIDGCYAGFLKYTDELLKPYSDAIRAGNPEALIAFNNGVNVPIEFYTALDDYTCGELNDFIDVPEERFINGVQWHVLAPIGLSIDGTEWGSWCKPGTKRDGAYMKEYVRKCNEKGGVVTIDVCLYRDGHIDEAQIETLKHIDKI